MNTTSNYEKIAQRAYQLWDKSGKPEGKENENWLQAEKEVEREELQRSGKSNLSPNKSGNTQRDFEAYSM